MSRPLEIQPVVHPPVTQGSSDVLCMIHIIGFGGNLSEARSHVRTSFAQYLRPTIRYHLCNNKRWKTTYG